MLLPTRRLEPCDAKAGGVEAPSHLEPVAVANDVETELVSDVVCG